ncbi:hypothetical protein FRX31_009748 [Thalictrum thalictroides]|uniref:Uncharacterized protein n=1 Tax=Thalictrum thalictroides TaxID=46969 RepID=A0A7J6WTE7_THATH|nr:hypothetical protein FRX31_009748 [Thalictrum thalictroides]
MRHGRAAATRAWEQSTSSPDCRTCVSQLIGVLCYQQGSLRFPGNEISGSVIQSQAPLGPDFWYNQYPVAFSRQRFGSSDPFSGDYSGLLRSPSVRIGRMGSQVSVPPISATWPPDERPGGVGRNNDYLVTYWPFSVRPVFTDPPPARLARSPGPQAFALMANNNFASQYGVLLVRSKAQLSRLRSGLPLTGRLVKAVRRANVLKEAARCGTADSRRTGIGQTPDRKTPPRASPPGPEGQYSNQSRGPGALRLQEIPVVYSSVAPPQEPVHYRIALQDFTRIDNGGQRGRMLLAAWSLPDGVGITPCPRGLGVPERASPAYIRVLCQVPRLLGQSREYFLRNALKPSHTNCRRQRVCVA